MKSIILFGILLLTLPLNGQKYRHFLEKSVWCISGADQGGRLKDIWFFTKKEDTLIENIKYSIIGSTQTKDIYIREDTVDKAVYVKKGNQPELLLYSFRMETGAQCFIYFNLGDAGFLNCTVKSVDSVLLEDGYHRRLIISEDQQYGRTFEIIEGIGCKSHPFFMNKLSDPTYWVQCKYNGDRTIYKFIDSLCKGNIYYENLNVNPIKLNSQFHVNPNPAKNSALITSEYTFELKIFDAIGKIVFKGNDIKEVSLSPGIYYFCFISDKIRESRKVVFD